MASAAKTTPVGDSVPKINNELAVGSDLEFQGRWEKIERVIWIVLLLFLICSFAGVFGRGPVADAEAKATDGSFLMKYQRIQRFGTPSVLDIQCQPQAIHDGKVLMWISDSLVKPLGNQRVIPQPEQSVVGQGGVLYSFPATTVPVSIEFQAQPSALGRSELVVRIPGGGEVRRTVFVMP